MSNGKVFIFTMLATLFFLISMVSATPIGISSSTKARSLLTRQDGFCHAQAPGMCTLSILFYETSTQASVLDNACYEVGGGRINGNGDFDLASQLKYKVDGNTSRQPNPSFCYAGECHGPTDPCWYFQDDSDLGAGWGFTAYYCQFTCSQG
jgi:hypothetical protein